MTLEEALQEIRRLTDERDGHKRREEAWEALAKSRERERDAARLDRDKYRDLWKLALLERDAAKMEAGTFGENDDD